MRRTFEYALSMIAMKILSATMVMSNIYVMTLKWARAGLTCEEELDIIYISNAVEEGWPVRTIVDKLL